MGANEAALWVSSAVALVAGVTDFVSARIPNALTYPAILAGFGLAIWGSGITGLGFSLLGLLIAAVPFLLAFVFAGGGGGDVKLMAAMGALMGFPAVLSLLAHSLVVGAAMGLAIILFHKPFTAVFSRDETALSAPARRPMVRYGVAVAIGMAWINIPGLWRLPGL